MEYVFFSDTSCNLDDSMIEQYDIHIFPLRFLVDGEQHQSYLKGHKSDLKRFYTMMREGKVITTSLPNIGEAQNSVEEVLKQGKDVIYVGFSSGLSGTFGAIDLMLRSLADKYPERKVLSVDTLAASGGEGLLLWHACQLAQAGKTIEEVQDWLEENKLHMAHWFTVDDLMFLFRGGRVSRTSAFAGTLLNIKPVMHVNDEGHLIPLEKVRGRKKSINALVEHMSQTANKPVSDQMVFITHGDCIEDAEYLASLVRERFGVERININYVDPVIGAHSGPGTLALFFLASER